MFSAKVKKLFISFFLISSALMILSCDPDSNDDGKAKGNNTQNGNGNGDGDGKNDDDEEKIKVKFFNPNGTLKQEYEIPKKYENLFKELKYKLNNTHGGTVLFDIRHYLYGSFNNDSSPARPDYAKGVVEQNSLSLLKDLEKVMDEDDFKKLFKKTNGKLASNNDLDGDKYKNYKKALTDLEIKYTIKSI